MAHNNIEQLKFNLLHEITSTFQNDEYLHGTYFFNRICHDYTNLFLDKQFKEQVSFAILNELLTHADLQNIHKYKTINKTMLRKLNVFFEWSDNYAYILNKLFAQHGFTAINFIIYLDSNLNPHNNYRVHKKSQNLQKKKEKLFFLLKIIVLFKLIFVLYYFNYK